MIGLPTSLNVAGEEYPIRTDYRVILTIFAAFNDPNLNDREKFTICLNCLYKVIPDDYEDAIKQAMWFIDGAELPGNGPSVRLMDWEQDEGMIFAAVNRVAGKEIRAVEYLHWWTFLGYFYEIGEGRFATVVGIRSKMAKGKTLTKEERELLRDNGDTIKLKTRYSDEEIEEQERLKAIFT